MTDPLLACGEAASFYTPLITDPAVGGTWYAGLQHVWRTQDNAGSQAFLDSNCNEFTGTFTSPCGDWVAIGQDLSSTAFGGKAPWQFIVPLRRAPSDNGTFWAGWRPALPFGTPYADNPYTERGPYLRSASTR